MSPSPPRTDPPVSDLHAVGMDLASSTAVYEYEGKPAHYIPQTSKPKATSVPPSDEKSPAEQREQAGQTPTTLSLDEHVTALQEEYAHLEQRQRALTAELTEIAPRLEALQNFLAHAEDLKKEAAAFHTPPPQEP